MCVELLCKAYRSDNFIVGLTNVSPLVTPPTLWNYAVCGQYQGAVADGATVSLQCTSKHLHYKQHLCRFHSPAVYLMHDAGVQIRYRPISSDGCRKFLRSGGLRSRYVVL